MNKEKVIGIIFIIIPFFIFLIGSFLVDNINEEKPCVDGDGDINLEGIMCDKSYRSFLGMNKANSQAVLSFTILISAFLVLVGLMLFVLSDINSPSKVPKNKKTNKGGKNE